MKRFLSALLAVVLIASMVSVGYAHSDTHGKEVHEKKMKKILFDDENHRLMGSQKEAFDALVYASQLVLDQANGSDERYLKKLRDDYKVSGLPKRISEIDFRVSAGTHRDYTHHGWDYDYSNTPKPGSDEANWPLRKEILLKTTAKVFGFQKDHQFLWFKWGDYDKKCNSMAALIYYIHVLADHQDYLDSIHSNYSGESLEMMPFVSESPNEPDVVSEILKHLGIIFEDQTDNDNYKCLTQDLKTIKEEAIRIKGKGTGEIDTVEKRALYKAQVDECIKCLSYRVHTLLEKEDFWQKVFP